MVAKILAVSLLAAIAIVSPGDSVFAFVHKTEIGGDVGAEFERAKENLKDEVERTKTKVGAEFGRWGDFRRATINDIRNFRKSILDDLEGIRDRTLKDLENLRNATLEDLRRARNFFFQMLAMIGLAAVVAAIAVTLYSRKKAG